jgi:hypothetical protein
VNTESFQTIYLANLASGNDLDFSLAIEGPNKDKFSVFWHNCTDRYGRMPAQRQCSIQLRFRPDDVPSVTSGVGAKSAGLRINAGCCAVKDEFVVELAGTGMLN